MLSDLLKLAADHGYLRNSWLENKLGWAMLLSSERLSIERNSPTNTIPASDVSQTSTRC